MGEENVYGKNELLMVSKIRPSSLEVLAPFDMLCLMQLYIAYNS